MEQPCAATLRGVLDAYTGHFSHEEALLDQHLYPAAAAAAAASSAAGEGFDPKALARKSHFNDHTRMLSALRAQLMAAALTPVEGAEAYVPPMAFVNQVLRDFEIHANRCTPPHLHF